MTAGLIVLLVVVGLVLLTLARTIRIIPQATAGVVERLGRYSQTLTPGLNSSSRSSIGFGRLIDMREQVVSFPPQPVITEDNLVVSIDTVIYFQVTEPGRRPTRSPTTSRRRRAADDDDAPERRRRPEPRRGAHQSRDNINGQLRVVLDEATGKWGIRVNRVELKAIDPPAVDPGLDGEADARRA